MGKLQLEDGTLTTSEETLVGEGKDGKKMKTSEKFAQGAQKAGAFVYSKGKVAVGFIAKKGKEISVL